MKNIIFDFGGVLVDWNPSIYVQKTLPDGGRNGVFP